MNSVLCTVMPYLLELACIATFDQIISLKLTLDIKLTKEKYRDVLTDNKINLRFTESVNSFLCLALSYRSKLASITTFKYIICLQLI